MISIKYKLMCKVLAAYDFIKSESVLAKNSYLVFSHWFVKVPQPGDSEGIFLVFELSCHLLLPV